MGKSENSKRKDALRKLRRHGKVFVREYQTFDKRNTGSGVTFGGEYVKQNNRKSERKGSSSRQKTDLYDSQRSE